MIEEIIGLITLFISMLIQVIIPPLPAELIVISAGKLYGVLITTIVAGSGLYLGSVVVYYIGLYIQKRFDHLFNKEKTKIIIQKLKHHEKWILWIRILPYNPSDIISYAAGIIRVEKRVFFTISFFTSYIRCLLLSILGIYIQSWQTAIQVVAILLVSAIITYSLVYRKKIYKNKRISQKE